MSGTDWQVDRRRFIKVSLMAGGGLAVACQIPVRRLGADTESYPQEGGPDFMPNAWIQIAPDDTVTVMIKHTELGQGITTGLSMIVAEELEADWSRVRPVIAPVAPAYVNPDHGVMGTGGSTGVKTSWEPLRLAGAATRELLIAAAAATWNVPAVECRAENSTVIHSPSDRRLRYGELLETAANLAPPENPKLKTPDQYRLIGRPVSRLDAADKARGKTVYNIDFKLPGMLTAAVVHAPLLGGKPVSVDDDQARTMPGVKAVVRLASSVAAVADTYWQAQNAIDTVDVKWDGGDPQANTQSIMAGFKDRITEKGRHVRDEGDVEKALKTAARRIRAAYELPYQAHLCPEPMNCTAHVQPHRCDIWAPTQSQEVARDMAAHITRLPLSAVFVHTPFVGGGFGRRGMNDFVDQAVRISKAVKAPVKVIWSRQEDVQHDWYRPAFYNEIEAGLDENGYPTAWWHKAVGQSQMETLIEASAPSLLPKWLPSLVKYPAAGLLAFAANRFISADAAMSGAATMVYGIDNVRMTFIRGESPVPVGAWRSVGDSRNAFVKECFMDEIAAATGKDPVKLRLHLLKESPRYRRVLEMAADKAGWGRRLPSSRFQGVALHAFHGTPVAMVAEVSIEKNNKVKVLRIVSAIDCGTAINPKLVAAQVRGSVAFGLSAALKSSVHIENGSVVESNFDDFPILGFHEMPEVAVHIVDSTDPPTGVGESGVPPVAPAVVNALYQATGKRLRSLPVDLSTI